MGKQKFSGQAVNKVGKYAYSELKKKNTAVHDDVKLREDVGNRKRQPKKVLTCFYCGLRFSSSIAEHREQCKAKNNKCKHCLKVGHFASVCRSSKPLRKVEFTEKDNNSENEEEDPDLYNIDIFRIKADENAPRCKLLSKLENKNDFKGEVIIKTSLTL